MIYLSLESPTLENNHFFLSEKTNDKHNTGTACIYRMKEWKKDVSIIFLVNLEILFYWKGGLFIRNILPFLTNTFSE